MNQTVRLFEQAQEHHEQGRLKQAEPLYIALLKEQPDHEEALFWLASLYTNQGRHQDAIDLYYRALALNPDAVETHTGLGLALNALGQAEDAEASFRQAVALTPEMPELHYYLGSALFPQKKYTEAEAAFRQAIQYKPEFLEAYINLRETLLKQNKLPEAKAVEQQIAEQQRVSSAATAAGAPAERKSTKPVARVQVANRTLNAGTYIQEGEKLLRARRFAQAIPCFQKALSLDPNSAAAHNGLAGAFLYAGAFEEAIPHFQQTIALQPNREGPFANLGTAFVNLRRYQEANDCFEKALAISPKNAFHWANLSASLIMLRRFDEAKAACNKALELNPNLPMAHMNLGIALMDTGAFEEAHRHCMLALKTQPRDMENLIFVATLNMRMRRYQEAEEALQNVLKMYPKDARARSEYGMLRLLQGKFENAWPDYEMTHVVSGSSERSLKKPQWKGESNKEATVLVHLDQGVGDCIQFSRYLIPMKERVGRVVLECRTPTIPIYAGNPAIDEIVLRPEDDSIPDTAFDYHISTTMLPGIFWEESGALGSAVPYVPLDTARVEKWRERFAAEPGFKVGLVWAGNTTYINDHLRSTQLANFAPLGGVPNVRLYSLQKGDPEKEAAAPPPGMTLTDLSSDLTDYGETAAVIANLDLVITVDTSVAHLAGALAKPVWTVLPFVSEWRWRGEGTTTDWYPTMRLFRPATFGGWQAEMEEVAQELNRLVNPS